MGRAIALVVLALAIAPPARAVEPAVANIAASAERASHRPDDKAVRARVESYLGSIDTVIPAQQWRDLGPGAGAVLQEIAQDRSALPTRRARAVWARGVVSANDAGATGGVSLMTALAMNEDEHPLVRTTAVRTMATLMNGPAMLATLRPMLETVRNTKVRVAAAEALVKRDRQLACPAVKQQVARETKGQRIAFTRAVAACR